MKMPIRVMSGKTIITPAKSAIMQYAGKLHKRYNKTKINVDRVKNLVDYSDL